MRPRLAKSGTKCSLYTWLTMTSNLERAGAVAEMRSVEESVLGPSFFQKIHRRNSRAEQWEMEIADRFEAAICECGFGAEKSPV